MLATYTVPAALTGNPEPRSPSPANVQRTWFVDATTVVTGVAESMGQPLSLHSELDVDVYRLHRVDAGSDRPDLVARVFGPSVERTIVDTAAAHVLQRLAPGSLPNAFRAPIRCWRSETTGTCSSPSPSNRHRLPVQDSYWPGGRASSADALWQWTREAERRTSPPALRT